MARGGRGPRAVVSGRFVRIRAGGLRFSPVHGGREAYHGSRFRLRISLICGLNAIVVSYLHERRESAAEVGEERD